MTMRYTDMDTSISGASDFVVRHRRPTAGHIITLIFVVLALAITTVVFVADKYMLAALIITLLGSVGWYMVLQVQRNHDLLLATEFQNALFASALGLNNKFCIIIRREGNIVYFDRAFQQIFPEFLKQPRRSLDILLEQGKVSAGEIEKIYSAIERGVYEKVIFNIRGAERKFFKIVMSVEPIMRPNGFILLRGREFVESRTAADQPNKNEVLGSSNVTLFSNVMDTLHMGIYMTDPNGNITYANSVLEHWLGFTDGEIVSSSLSLSDVINHNQPIAEQIVPDDYEGEIKLRKKNGSTMNVFMNQKIVHNNEGKLMGCAAIVHDFSNQTKEMKKKLW